MLQALIGSIFGVGLFLILADYFRVPFFKTSKAINNLAKRQEKKTSTLDIWLGDLAMWISKRLRINEFKRMQLEIDLRSAGVNMSPEMHIANSIVKSMLIGILAVPMLFIFPLLSPIIVALAVMMYFKASKGVADKIKEIGLDVIDQGAPIIPVMLYDEHVAVEMAKRMMEKGVYVVAFSYPVVPKGKARIRTQLSAALSREDIEYIVGCFRQVKEEMGL